MPQIPLFSSRFRRRLKLCVLYLDAARADFGRRGAQKSSITAITALWIRNRLENLFKMSSLNKRMVLRISGVDFGEIISSGDHGFNHKAPAQVTLCQ